MSTPTPTLHCPNDLVCAAWIRTIPGLTADGVAAQLPSDETSWAANGFVVVPMTVGGSPHDTMPLRRPVVQVEAWGTVPGSDKLPWGIPNQLCEQIRAGTYDRLNFGRPLAITSGPVAYPSARVLSAKVMTEPRRVFSDAGDYAGYQMDLQFQWVQLGEVIP
jgi:hypothetical protein